MTSNCLSHPFQCAHSERGITLYMAAAGMFALLGFVALAVDMGMLYQVRNESQNIADAAALAGAREAFLTNPADKVQEAREAARSAARKSCTSSRRTYRVTHASSCFRPRVTPSAPAKWQRYAAGSSISRGSPAPFVPMPRRPS